jgi:putative SOS response-associated peptidase YedK
MHFFVGTGQPTCTIITTHSSKFFSDIHNRMPVILEKCDIDKWINNDVIWNDLPIDDLLKPFEGELDV